MTTDAKQAAVDDGHRAAKTAKDGDWGFLGFIFPFVAVLFAHASRPIVPGHVLASHDDESTLRFFEAAYINTRKNRCLESAWIGSWLGLGVLVIAGFLLFAEELV